MLKRIYQWLAMLSICMAAGLSLSGCTQEIQQANLPDPREKAPADEETGKKKTVPIVLGSESFEKVYGWADEDTILYSAAKGGKHHIYTHHITTGASREIFQTEAPIVSILLHPNRQKLLIHTAPNTYAATITITDLSGNAEYTTDIESYELAYEWNEKDSSSIAITAFYEDWSFEQFYLDLNSKELQTISTGQPFVKWLGEGWLLQQEWKEEDAAFFAPLVKVPLEGTGQHEVLFEEVFRFDAFDGLLMTTSIPDEKGETLNYQFYGSSMELMSSFEVPSLSQYSDWLIPYYDYTAQAGELITLVPEHSGAADQYAEGFQLWKWDVSSGESKQLFAGLDNMPLSCSPAGTVCLYGHRLEELLMLDSGERIKLVKKEEK
ncbi:MAG TPA: hypothetical protein VIG80_16370 [Bacillaceae bacterium]